jgi:hypothetical protein
VAQVVADMNESSEDDIDDRSYGNSDDFQDSASANSKYYCSSTLIVWPDTSESKCEMMVSWLLVFRSFQTFFWVPGGMEDFS